ncbi:helicase [Tanacetum coccineum]
MDNDSVNMDAPFASRSNILHKPFNICSRTIITRDGKVQSYCGLKLTNNIDTQASGKPPLPNNTNAGVPITYHNLGPPSYECRSCNAQIWYEERTNKGNRAINPTFSLCCQEGKVLLPKFKEMPPPLDRLLNFQDHVTAKFRDQIRVYNGMFCFTSFGARIDHSINMGRGLYTFRINGQNYHRIGSLLPAVGFQLRYAQLYLFDTHNEVRNQMSALLDTETGQGVDETIVAGLITMLDNTSIVAQAFQMARDWCHSHESVNFELCLLSERTSARQYNAPMVSEVAALITKDFVDDLPSRDIVVDSKDGGLKRILELHPSYMALQYPLLFPYGEDGFHEKIPYHTNRGTRKTKRGYVSMKEYYAYVIQQRNGQGNTLLSGGHLYHQYLVDAYTAIEEQRLQWTRNNQDTLWEALYHNLNDAFTRGDTNAEGLGKRIVLPRTFTRGPRYMMQNYQDAMALCRAYRNPDLFITFTSNPKWPEIGEMMAFIPGQKPYERPKVGTRVFKLKLTHLLDVVYVIEFQKRGLPHAHILLWLKEEWKCKTPNQVDDIISADLPSLTTDPEGYKVVTEFMLHGSYGKGDACTVEGKCSKTFPKPFYSETNLEEDGYPVYRRRDSKVQAVKDQQAITLHDSQNLPALLNREEIKITMFTEWFELNKRDTKARELTYAEIPNFKELMTVNKKLYPTFKAACFAYGLLNDDKEWAHAIKEAAFWALAPQLRDLFMTMLLFYDVSRPLQQWEQTWELLSEDILCKKRKLFKLLELSRPNPTLLTQMDNRLIRKAMDFDIKTSKIEHDQLHSLLNPKQRGTGKTFLYKTIISRLRSERQIVLAVASSGGQTAHSRFVIPLKLVENSTCGIKQNTRLAELLQQVQLIIWDSTNDPKICL